MKRWSRRRRRVRKNFPVSASGVKSWRFPSGEPPDGRSGKAPCRACGRASWEQPGLPATCPRRRTSDRQFLSRRIFSPRPFQKRGGSRRVSGACSHSQTSWGKIAGRPSASCGTWQITRPFGRGRRGPEKQREGDSPCRNLVPHRPGPEGGNSRSPQTCSDTVASGL